MHVVTPSDTRGQEHEGYRVPAPQAPMTQHWVPAGKTVKFAGVDLPGPLYFGRPVEGMESEPSSIDPTLPIAAVGDFFRVARSLWASYKTLAMHERRGYVDWLATGRSHPDVDMRLVFMYFYGLERRLVVDLPKDQSILRELPAIEAELIRLRDTYEQREKSFATAVDSLLHWVKQPGAPKALYAKKDVEFRRVHGLRVYKEVAVGQAVLARQPIQARMALTWAFESATVYLPAECKPLRPQFEALFEELFAAVHPSGMHINSPPARYELHYRAASPALTGHPATSVRLADAADTKLLEDPLQQIKAIFKAAQTEIERYAKIVARGGGVPQVKLEELQSLPMRLWPEHSKASLRGLVKRVRVFTWLGDAANEVISLRLLQAGLTSGLAGVGLDVQKDGMGPKGLSEVLAEMAAQPMPSVEELLAGASNIEREKWDWALPTPLLCRSYASVRLDVQAASQWLEHFARRHPGDA